MRLRIGHVHAGGRLQGHDDRPGIVGVAYIFPYTALIPGNQVISRKLLAGGTPVILPSYVSIVVVRQYPRVINRHAKWSVPRGDELPLKLIPNGT